MNITATSLRSSAWGSKTQIRSRSASVVLVDEPAQQVPQANISRADRGSEPRSGPRERVPPRGGPDRRRRHTRIPSLRSSPPIRTQPQRWFSRASRRMGSRDLGINRRPRAAGPTVRPLPPHELAMPPEDGRRPDLAPGHRPGPPRGGEPIDPARPLDCLPRHPVDPVRVGSPDSITRTLRGTRGSARRAGPGGERLGAPESGPGVRRAGSRGRAHDGDRILVSPRDVLGWEVLGGPH